MVYLARRTAPNTAAPTDPGYDPNEQKRTQVVFEDWTPKNLGPHQENVEVYSNCDEVELFLNSRSLGKKAKPANDSPRNWMVDFEQGTIRAVCTRFSLSQTGMNSSLPFFELKTAGEPAAIELSVDKSKLSNDWNDVVFVTAIVVDANGVPVLDADNLVRFDAKGTGFIAAVDSADNTDHDPFQSTQRKAYQGRCVAYIKTDKASGAITVAATAGPLKSNKITIAVRK